MEAPMTGEHNLVTEKTLVPGNPGTKKWIKQYGDNLICIRYKYDRNTKMKVKTVELEVERKPCKIKTRIPWNKTVKVRIRYGEIHLWSLVKSVGGKWNAVEKVWEAPYGEIKMLGLTHRIVR
jgi:hypothetical protein